MTPTVGDVVAELAHSFNLDKAAGWDPVGLQFGDPGAEVASIAVCHEVTQEVVDRLVATRVDLVITYHPLLFRPTQRLVAGNTAAGRAFQLVAAGTALVAVHTAFDVLPGGTADALAEALGLERVTGFGPAWGTDTSKVVTFAPEDAVAVIVAAMADAGAGTIGRYTHCSFRSDGTGSFYPQPGASPVAGEGEKLNTIPEAKVEMVAPSHAVDRVVAALVAAHPYEEPAFDVVSLAANAGFIGRQGFLREPMDTSEVADLVAARLGGVLRVAGSGPVKDIAVIPGSGGGMLTGVSSDLIVTGDVSHHQAREAVAHGLNVIDPGHAATERPGVRALYAAVAETYGDAIDLTGVDADPWKEP